MEELFYKDRIGEGRSINQSHERNSLWQPENKTNGKLKRAFQLTL